MGISTLPVLATCGSRKQYEEESLSTLIDWANKNSFDPEATLEQVLEPDIFQSIEEIQAALTCFTDARIHFYGLDTWLEIKGYNTVTDRKKGELVIRLQTKHGLEYEINPTDIEIHYSPGNLETSWASLKYQGLAPAKRDTPKDTQREEYVMAYGIVFDTSVIEEGLPGNLPIPKKGLEIVSRELQSGRLYIAGTYHPPEPTIIDNMSFIRNYERQSDNSTPEQPGKLIRLFPKEK